MLAALLTIFISLFAMKDPVEITQDNSSCEPSDILNKCSLTVAVVNSPITYYIGASGEEGFEYELFKDFADDLDVRLDIIQADDVKEALQLVVDGEADMAAAGFTESDIIPEGLLKSPGFRRVKQVFVCNRNVKTPRRFKDLTNLKVMINKTSLYNSTMESIAVNHPYIRWVMVEDLSEEELLSAVAAGDTDCTLVNSDIANLTLRYMPDLKITFSAPKEKAVFWVVGKDNGKIVELLKKWFGKAVKNGKLADISDKYFGFLKKMEYFDIMMFHKRVDVRLPKLKKYFQEAGEKYNFDWKFLAAVAYQESHWDNDSVSKTGVKGIMMLTNDTADYLGIKNRLNPKDSIIGGAQYLRLLIDKMPESVEGEDRVKIGLAAYNVGFGHVLDARKVAVWLGLNRDLWRDLKRSLPLLTKQKIFSRLEYGYARGMEPVIYVDSIYNYYDILNKIIEEDAN